MITTKVATIYATLEARAAPQIPHIGIRYKFKEIVSDSERENVWGFNNFLDNEILWFANTSRILTKTRMISMLTRTGYGGC